MAKTQPKFRQKTFFFLFRDTINDNAVNEPLREGNICLSRIPTLFFLFFIYLDGVSIYFPHFPVTETHKSSRFTFLTSCFFYVLFFFCGILLSSLHQNIIFLVYFLFYTSVFLSVQEFAPICTKKKKEVRH